MSDMRAKVHVTGVTPTHGENGRLVQEKVEFRPVAKDGGYPSDGSDEDNTFAHFSPSGRFEIDIANPELHGKFAAGDKFYVDFKRIK